MNFNLNQNQKACDTIDEMFKPESYSLENSLEKLDRLGGILGML